MRKNRRFRIDFANGFCRSHLDGKPVVETFGRWSVLHRLIYQIISPQCGMVLYARGNSLPQSKKLFLKFFFQHHAQCSIRHASARRRMQIDNDFNAFRRSGS